eukprot:8902151-Alexandrium_andersonii.AAC.1
MVGLRPERTTASIAWLPSWTNRVCDFPIRQPQREWEGKPSCRMAKSIATNSASGVEWLEQRWRLLSPASGKE